MSALQNAKMETSSFFQTLKDWAASLIAFSLQVSHAVTCMVDSRVCPFGKDSNSLLPGNFCLAEVHSILPPGFPKGYKMALRTIFPAKHCTKWSLNLHFLGQSHSLQNFLHLFKCRWLFLEVSDVYLRGLSGMYFGFQQEGKSLLNPMKMEPEFLECISCPSAFGPFHQNVQFSGLRWRSALQHLCAYPEQDSEVFSI